VTRIPSVFVVHTRAHTGGVSLEIDELQRVPQSPPPAVVVALSFGEGQSEQARAKVGRLATEFLQIDGPEDARAKLLVAVPWLVSRLQRSGPTGMEILTEASRRFPYLKRFLFFGPFWTAKMLEANTSHPPARQWWPDVERLNTFMRAEGVGDLGRAWQTMVDVIEASPA
jgi:hypothetical protein